MLGHADEDCPASVRRTLPDVILIDTLHPCASSPQFYEETAALGARVVALAPDWRDDQARVIARRQNARCITLPTDYERFSESLRPIELA